MAAFFAIPAVAGAAVQVVRAATPYIAKELAKRFGAKQISKTAANKINKNPSTITNINQIKPKTPSLKPKTPSLKPKTKVVKPKSGVTSQQRSALSDMGGRTVGVKPRSNVTTPRTTSAASKPKGNTQIAKRVQDLVASAARGSKTRSGGSVPSGGTKTMRNVTPPKPRPKSPLGRPSKSPSISNRQRVGNMGKQAAATAAGVAALQKMKPKTSTVTAPKSRPQVQGPPKAKAKPSEGKDPRGNQIKATPGKMIMPKKFDGGYNSKTQKLVNITVDGKKSTYEIPKGMTTKQAKSLLTGTAKKKAGGPPGRFKAKPAPMPKIPPRKKKPGYTAKPAPMPKPNPKKKPGYKLKPAPMPKVKPKTKRMADNPKLKMMLKSGGSINSSIVARQVKGFGAARKPKK